ncbi:MAG: GNAT family N-acetyltransferase [Pseudomonadota bacterium]
MNDYSIRPAIADDAAAISQIVSGWAHHYLADPAAEDAQPFLASLAPAPTAERIGAAEFRYFVAQDATGVCGVIAMRDGNRIHHLFIRADANGKGIARALWEHARNASGHTSFFVNSAPPAIPVYERFGFVVVGAQQTRHGLDFVPMEFTSS